MDNDIDLDTLTAAEREVAFAALRGYRAEETLRKQRMDRLRDQASWKNIMRPHRLCGLEALALAADNIGYPLVEWNGWIYSTDDALAGRVGLEDFQVCLSEALGD